LFCVRWFLVCVTAYYFKPKTPYIFNRHLSIALASHSYAQEQSLPKRAWASFRELACLALCCSSIFTRCRCINLYSAPVFVSASFTQE
jgi:hypothetical protein